MNQIKNTKPNLLKGTRVYLSGPMDFVASRQVEKKHGWRNRIGQFLRYHGATVFDPWNKPVVTGFWEYGQEDEKSADARKLWTFAPSPAGAERRAKCAELFWQTLHIDLRMVDISDLVIAYCPTNIYSVGTPHELIQARQQHKPVLFVSPPVVHTALDELTQHLRSRSDAAGIKLLSRLEEETPIKRNPDGIPSLWYMPLVDTELFFDGFGFGDPALRKKFDWTKTTSMDRSEIARPPQRPLLSFLVSLARGQFPKKWNRGKNCFEKSDDWLLLGSGPGME